MVYSKTLNVTPHRVKPHFERQQKLKRMEHVTLFVNAPSNRGLKRVSSLIQRRIRYEIVRFRDIRKSFSKFISGESRLTKLQMNMFCKQ